MLSEANFTSQAPLEVSLNGYAMTLPSRHPLLAFLNPKSPGFQPYRETGLVKVAQALQALGRTGTAIDVGANVGDSCSLIHRHSSLRVLCIEASDFFFPYLTRNIARSFADRATARHAYVVGSSGERPKGLFHWGGTAKAVDQPFGETSEVLAVPDLIGSAGEVALFKVDIDGFDLGVVAAAIACAREKRHPFPIFFELEFTGTTLEDVRSFCADALEFFRQAADAGYFHSFWWDDPGRFFGLIDLRQPQGVINAVNYMGHFRHRTIWGFDICLVHGDDEALFAELSSGVSRDSVLPVGAT